MLKIACSRNISENFRAKKEHDLESKCAKIWFACKVLSIEGFTTTTTTKSCFLQSIMSMSLAMRNAMSDFTISTQKGSQRISGTLEDFVTNNHSKDVYILEEMRISPVRYNSLQEENHWFYR